MVVSSVTTNSATVTWEQPVDSFIPENYVLKLARAVGTEQPLCPDVEDESFAIIPSNIFFVELHSLHVFSLYEVKITANYDVFGVKSTSEPVITIFSTPSAGTYVAVRDETMINFYMM